VALARHAQTAGYTQTPWACIGVPAAALVPGSGATMFACQGSDRALWQSDSLGGAAWSAAVSLGGVLIGGPAVVAGSQETDFLAEGTDHAIWQRTPAGWTSLGGSVVGGVGAVGLNMPAAPAWGNAIPVPGLNAVADVTSVSCPSAGNCTAGGYYADTSGLHAFVADEVTGTWGSAIEVPGTAALNTGGTAVVGSVSCPSAGNCAADGGYTDALGHSQTFVAHEVNGAWDNAIEVPGTAALNASGNGGTGPVSCPSAGNCTLGGYYQDSSGVQAFVAEQVNGTWNNAIQVPGPAALNTSGNAQVGSVSCPSAGNCALGGYYQDSTGLQAFVAEQVNGTWNNAIQVPGTAALNSGGTAYVASVSCPSAGNCVAGGSYADTSSTGLTEQAFVADEVNGTWGDAIEVPRTAVLNSGGSAQVTSVSCPSAGNCAVGGSYADSPSHSAAFVADEVNGTWGAARQVTGLSTYVASVSCPSAGNCAAGGYYFDSGSGQSQAFVVSEVNGTWGEAIQVPGTASVNSTGSAQVDSVSCPSAGNCTAGGAYTGSSNTLRAFVVSQG
jgi:hypothetical protein